MANTNLNKNVGSLLTAAEVNLLLAVDSNGNFGMGTTAPNEFLEIAANKNATNAGANPIFSVENLRTSSGTSAAEILFRTYETDATSHNRAVIRASANASVNNNCGIFEIFTANSAGTLTKALDVDEKQFLSLVNTPTLQTDASYALRLNEGYELSNGKPYQNLRVKRASVSTIDIDIDSVILKDSTNNTFFKFSSVDLTVDLTASGANGLDTGAEANSTFYYVWVIGKTDGTKAGLLSASATSPTMPAGYTLKLRVGFIYNNSSGDIIVFTQKDDLVKVSSAELGTSSSTTTFSQVSLSGLIPSSAISIFLRVATLAFTSNSDNYRITPINDSANQSPYEVEIGFGSTGTNKSFATTTPEIPLEGEYFYESHGNGTHTYQIVSIRIEIS